MTDIYILPFDHRSTFVKDIFGFVYPLTSAQQEKVRQAKGIVFGGFKKVYEKREDSGSLGILCDEEFGINVLEEAKQMGVNFAVCVEKSGQEIFDFEYGPKFGEHLKLISPTFAKALVRYNSVNQEINKIQLERLKTLYDFCASHKIKLMVEPLIPPTKQQLAEVGGDKTRFDLRMRPVLVLQMISEFYEAGIFPDIWKIEALENEEAWKKTINQAVLFQGKKINCRLIVLGRGESGSKVEEWLKLAAGLKEVSGFAVGRTVFLEPLKQWAQNKLSEKEAVEEIAKRYSDLIAIWQIHRKF